MLYRCKGKVMDSGAVHIMLARRLYVYVDILRLQFLRNPNAYQKFIKYTLQIRIQYHIRRLFPKAI